MSEDALIRFENLDAFVKAKGWGPKELAAATGRKPNQCSDMLRRSKSFGEKIARDFERQLDLPRNWFDQIHDQKDDVLVKAELEKLNAANSQSAVKAMEPRASLSIGRTTPSSFGAKNWLRAPAVVWARLGEELFLDNINWPAEELSGFATTRTPHGTRFKVIEVPDDRLAPRIVAGDMVVIDPDLLDAKRNQVVLARGPDGEFILGRYTPLPGTGSFELCDAHGRALDSTRHGLTHVGTAIGFIPCDL